MAVAETWEPLRSLALASEDSFDGRKRGSRVGQVFALGPVSSSSESRFTSSAFWSEQLSARLFSLTFNPRRFCLWEIRFTLPRGILGVFGSLFSCQPL